MDISTFYIVGRDLYVSNTSRYKSLLPFYVNTSVFHIVGCHARSSTPRRNPLLLFHGNIGYVKAPHAMLYEHGQAGLTFYVVRELSVKFGLHAGNTKFSTQKEE